MGLHKAVGITLGVAALFVFTINVGVELFVKGSTPVEALANPAVWSMILFGAVYLATAFYQNAATRIVQVVGIFLVAAPTVIDDPDAFYGLALFVIGIVLAWKYEMLRHRPRLKLAGLTVYFLVLTYIGMRTVDAGRFRPLTVFAFIFVFLLILWFALRDTLRRYERVQHILTRSNAQMRPFAELGMNITGLIHDLRGDVAGLRGIASLEDMEGNGSGADRIRRFTDRINWRVKSIIDIATSNDAREVEEIDLKRLLESVVYYFFGLNKELRRQVSYQLEAEEPITLRARREALLVILENVIKNSVEATEEAEERLIHLTLRRREKEAVLLVENSGPSLPWEGVEEVDVRRSPHFRRGFTTKADGTGLGMQNVIRALEQLGGEMVMRNSSMGVRAEISLPLGATEERHSSKREHSRVNSSSGESS